MHETSIGAVTLEMDSKLTALLREADAQGVDISNPQAITAAGQRLVNEAHALLKQGYSKEATQAKEEGKSLLTIGSKLLPVAPALRDVGRRKGTIKIVVDPVPQSIVTPETPFDAHGTVMPTVDAHGTVMPTVDGGLSNIAMLGIVVAVVGCVWFLAKRA